MLNVGSFCNLRFLTYPLAAEELAEDRLPAEGYSTVLSSMRS